MAKKTNPARGQRDRALKKFSLAANCSENIANLTTFQAQHLARRFGVSPSLAEIIATLAYPIGEAAR